VADQNYPSKLMREPAACACLGGISHWKFWNLIKTGALDAVDIGGSTMVTVESIDRLIEAGRAKRANRLGRRAQEQTAA
jgi:hypothetical protein